MYYSVDITHHFDLWRLREDQTWRRVDWDNLDVALEDKRFGSATSLALFQDKNMVVTLDGAEVKVNESEWPGSHYYIEFRLHRNARPAIPSETEMLDVIRRGDDSLTNVLTLGVDGHFRLLNRHVHHGPFDFVHDPTIAVRMETLGAGNGYVGAKSTKYRAWWHQNYVDFLVHWTTHLMVGIVNIYDDAASDQPEDKVIRELEEALARWP